MSHDNMPETQVMIEARLERVRMNLELHDKWEDWLVDLMQSLERESESLREQSFEEGQRYERDEFESRIEELEDELKDANEEIEALKKQEVASFV